MRRWISYPMILSHRPSLWLWKRTMCRAGIHLFDEVHSFGPGLIGPELIAAVERETGLLAIPMTGSPDDESESRYLYCDACELTVPISDQGGVWD